MITYDSQKPFFLLMFRMEGSVFPAAARWAIPSTIFGVILRLTGDEQIMVNAGITSQVWAGFNLVLGILLAFRTQQSYARFWQGATLMSKMSSEWYNATSLLFALCATDDAKKDDVGLFQDMLVRLISLLSCTALQDIAVIADEEFELLGYAGIDQARADFLAIKQSCLKSEIVMQWVQRLIIDACRNGTIDQPAPLVTRCFQELASGIVYQKEAREITDVATPFPFVQMIAVTLAMHACFTPLFVSRMIESVVSVAILTFANVFLLFCINAIALEIECPFGDDPNDLPVPHIQCRMNASLMMLLENSDEQQKVPSLTPGVALLHAENCSKNLYHSEGLMEPKSSPHSTPGSPYCFAAMMRHISVGTGAKLTKREKINAARNTVRQRQNISAAFAVTEADRFSDARTIPRVSGNKVTIADDENEMEPKTEPEGNSASSKVIPCVQDIILQDVSQCVQDIILQDVSQGDYDDDAVKDERTPLAESSDDMWERAAYGHACDMVTRMDALLRLRESGNDTACL